MKAKHILCRSRDLTPSEGKLMIDNGEDMNIPKLSNIDIKRT